jgi:pSer/pThr/pTyr-binding forkhead associated (FHA) protein
MSKIFIRFVWNDQAYSFFLPEYPIFIGRSPKCDLVIEDEHASFIHCEMGVLNDGHPYVKDLNSKNGIYINEEKVELSVLYIGDVLQIGTLSLSIDDKRTDKELLNFLKRPMNNETKLLKRDDISRSIPLLPKLEKIQELTMSKIDVSELKLDTKTVKKIKK